MEDANKYNKPGALIIVLPSAKPLHTKYII